MKKSYIRWQKKDYLYLGRVVARFNSKIENLGRKRNLPKIRSYEEIKSSITTRRELNRVINSMNRFLKEGAEEIVELPNREKITKWEKTELAIETRIAKANLRRQMRPYEKIVKGSGVFSKAQMGNSEYRALKRTYESLKNPFSRSAGDFARIKSRIETLGVSDLEMKRAIIYRNNYLNVLKKYSGYDNYDLLMKKLNSFSNPISFYNFMSKDDIIVDLTYQSDEYMAQMQFNNFLYRLGIEFENDSMEIEDDVF